MGFNVRFRVLLVWKVAVGPFSSFGSEAVQLESYPLLPHKDLGVFFTLQTEPCYKLHTACMKSHKDSQKHLNEEGSLNVRRRPFLESTTSMGA